MRVFATVVCTAILAGIVFAPPLAAQPAAPAEASGRIESVTVYPDRARVVRRVPVRVSAGEGRLEIPGLPADLDADSLRIRAEGPQGLVLGATATRTVRGAERVQDRARELEAEIRRVRDRLTAVDYRLEALGLQRKLLESLAASPAGEGAPPQAADWRGMLETIGAGAGEVLEERLAAEQQRREIASELERLEQELADLGAERRDTRTLAVDYRAGSAGEAVFELAYMVSGAGWQPVYQLRLDTAGGEGQAALDVSQRARVRQDTGEDWDEVDLRVSLGRPSLGGRLPELYPWYVDILRPEPKEEMDRARVTSARMAEMQAAPADDAVLEAGEFSAEYRVPGRVTVASDGSEREFGLAEHRFPGRVSARAVPARQAHAWLYFTGENDSEAMLPPGPATLFQDGEMVGRQHLERIPAGGEMALAFGVDERIEISHTLVEDTRGSEGLLRKSETRQRDFLVEITNRHEIPLEITVLDRMPVARDERIQVALTEGSEEPTVRDLDDRPGILAWTREYAPGESHRLNYGFRLTYPEDTDGISGW